MMDRKQYMKEVYSKYWLTARETIYGFTSYDKNLCEYLTGNATSGARMLEVAVGTGYPLADELQKKGYALYGIDLSAELILKCRQTNANIAGVVGDSEQLPFSDAIFDCTYCFHSTWYFPDLGSAIREMLRVTRSPGLSVFDIQNRCCQSIQRAYDARLAQTSAGATLVRWLKNCAKLALRVGTPQWHAVVHEVPADPERVCAMVSGQGISSYRVMAARGGQLVALDGRAGCWKDDERLVFAVHK